jgi:hypothetical protein
MPTTTVYQDAATPTNLSVDSSNNLYVASGLKSLTKILAGNQTKSSVAIGQNLTGGCEDSNGNVFHCLDAENCVYKNGQPWVTDPRIVNPRAVVCDSNINVYVACFGTNLILKITQS